VAAHLSPTALLAAVALLIGIATCRDTTEGVRTQFFGTYAFTTTERRVIARIAGEAGREVRTLLPALAPQITLRVRSGTDVIPELGAIGTALAPDTVVWTVDPNRPEGVVKIAGQYLRQALFHEFHHLVRATALPQRTLMDQVIFEGMATAFERDFAGAEPPWGQYPENVDAWVDELLLMRPETQPTDWAAFERDDRRRLRYRAGTYLVDQAMKRLHRSSAELVSTPTAEILKAARP